MEKPTAETQLQNGGDTDEGLFYNLRIIYLCDNYVTRVGKT